MSYDDFSTILDWELQDDLDDLDFERVKRQKVESQVPSSETIVSLPQKEICRHPATFGGLCTNCGLRLDHHSAIPFKYINKDLRITNDGMARLRDKDVKDMLCHRKKLYLVLDLDHTLLNSARLTDIKEEEAYLNNQRDSLPDTLKTSLFKVDKMAMMTKLRPFVQTFLEEANKLFEMCIYTMGQRPYALEMANLLDPGNKYFQSRIIAQADCTRKHQKGLDIFLGRESTVLILDDTQAVWKENQENLILMDRYHFFASSCNDFGFNHKSHSLQKTDESESKGALATILKVLQQVHTLFFDREHKDNIEDRDVRQVLKTVRKEILKDCKIVFTRVIPINFKAEQHWRMAEQLGATCSTEVDPSVTHVVSGDAGTKKSQWAVRENKYLVSPGWIEASNFLWRKQPEEVFSVSPATCKQ